MLTSTVIGQWTMVVDDEALVLWGRMVVWGGFWFLDDVLFLEDGED